MELWIRSQDKEKLVLTKGFETQHTNYDGGCQIFAVWENNYQMVGKYKTKKRALEVLDEIQKLLMPQVILKSIDTSVEIANLNYIVNPTYETIQQLNTYVYEMPKE